jgi:hypothetical protein
VQVKDEFAQDHALDHPLPVFLTGDSQRFEDEHGNSLLIKMSLLVVATIAIGVAMTLALGVPLPKSLFADTTPTDPPAARMISDQSTPPNPAALPDQSTVQTTNPSTADAGQTASIAPTGSTPAASDAAPDASADSQAAAPAASGELLKQFQSWAAAQDSQPPAAPAPSAPSQVDAIRPIQQNESVRPMQNTSPPQTDAAQGAPTTRIIQDDPLPARAVHKHHKPPLTQNARAEIGAPKAARPANRPDRAARAEARPPQDGRPTDQPPQPTQPPSLLQSLGLSRQ